MSTASSFLQQYQVKAKVSDLIDLGGTTITGSLSNEAGDETSLEVKRTGSETQTLTNLLYDGINHGDDIIRLWLNPKANIVKTWRERTGGQVVPNSTFYGWSLTFDSPDNKPRPKDLFVSWLTNPSSMPASIQAELAAVGIQPADYATILSADPLVGGASMANNPRYIFYNEYPYTPPSNSGAQSSINIMLNSDEITNRVSNSSLVGSLSLEQELKFAVSWVKIELDPSATWTWTHKRSVETSTGYSAVASGTIGAPSANYSGGTRVFVYWDTLFHTFAFEIGAPTSQPLIQGIVSNNNGSPRGNVPVSVKIGTAVRRTVTDQNGNYAFYQLPPGQTATVNVQGVGAGRQVMLGQPSTTTQKFIIE